MASYLYNTTDPTHDLKRNLSYGKQSLDGPLFQQRAFCFRLPGYQKFTFTRKPLMMAVQVDQSRDKDALPAVKSR